METWNQLPEWIIWGGAGLLGLLVGSFLNVVVHRLPAMLERRWSHEARDILGTESEGAAETTYHLGWPPSHCPQCQRRLRAWENIPLLSYLLQRGCCRGCRARIPARYPIIEALTGIATATVVASHGLSPLIIGPLLLTWVLIAAAAIDYEHYLLPDALTLPVLWLGLIWSIVDPGSPTPTDAILGAVAGYLALWAIFHGHRLVTGREGMGYGDFKLTAALGAWLGWQALPALVLFAALTGLAVALLLAVRSRPLGQPLPFGPALAVAGWLLLVLSPAGVAWQLV
ncbi:prepilin peptidase [Halorhodospira halophila]|uniref:prepilin peptidase n=1 Tax=Halorhodospira halophila TaxID=1053 RepID=UPI001F5D3510|nr:A24 family peptidase [Halorhodospira halophila]